MDRQSVPDYLEMVKALGLERSEPVTQVAWQPLEFIDQEIVDAADRPAYQRWVRELMAPQLAALGRTKQASDTEAALKTRARVLARLAIVGHDAETIAELKQLAEQYLQDPDAVDPSVVDVAIDSATMYGDEAFQIRMIAALDKAARPDVRSRLDYGLAGFTSPALLDRTLQRTLTPAGTKPGPALHLVHGTASPRGPTPGLGVHQEPFRPYPVAGGLVGADRGGRSRQQLLRSGAA